MIDLHDHPLPHLDEPAPAPVSPGRYQHEHTRAWADTIASFDGFVMVTPEYNHSFPGVLKNAIDSLYAEWNNKAVGFVSYGGGGGTRAVEQLRLICGALHEARCLKFPRDLERQPDIQGWHQGQRTTAR
ncbi:hypothetical protein GCM10011579_065480 [Streptomyces albiflavescens]|uniref:NADPH-dependent FMN reductase-like domain-containing protein n=1 Tax=Streptomyces albiflavescens TaxID=1623582 RepID=A0A917YAC4_9ACTN|nr:hypothetical protein GCM10011579_065480 [Streptomyces albiflavescens]